MLLHNVAAGVAPTDAANVSQLPGSWHISNDEHVRVQQCERPGGQVTLGNVAPGAITATSTQAVNGSQLYAINQSVGGLSQSLTQLRSQMNSNFNELAGGIASAMALGTMRFDDRPGKLSAGVGVSGFDGQMGFAAGAGYTPPTRTGGSPLVLPSRQPQPSRMSAGPAVSLIPLTRRGAGRSPSSKITEAGRASIQQSSWLWARSSFARPSVCRRDARERAEA